ncbi:LptF/LptG family permease [Fodinibius sp.]|uniref:LptF/LptG family permease n=1 Tax=Fodinibius sp. TaxID=1872440 RepID=UPI002ACD2351|nr:LptF/LptG family permease [Fodinibius sp.]MDZ7659730.1 LptF/LptG family permease [Fodinibius sp.]
MRLLPNKLQLDILKRHIGPFIFCFCTLMFLLLMQFLILYIDLLIGKGLPLEVILELIITNLASMVVLAVPMAVLVASLMAYGKITELNELTAIRAAGINPIHVINPVLVASILLSIFLIWFSNDILPDANQRARSLFIDIRLKKPGFDLKENEFYEGIDNYTFLVKEITNESDSLRDVTIYQHPTRDRKEAYIKG